MGCWRCVPKAKSFHVKIILLDKQELIQEIQEKTTGQDLLDNIFKYLNLLETAYFGLRYQDSVNQTHWIEPGKRVSNQIRGIVPITLYLGVKFYAADPSRLVEEITRYQFFLQVKEDILQGRLPISQELAVELSALALQSELGDYDPNRHSMGYVSEFRFLATQTEEMESEIESVHASMSGLGIVPSSAEMTYLEKVKWLDMYGVDLHPVIGEDNIEYFLGLTPSGIIVLRNRSKVGNYFWPRITKIYFKGKYFMLKVRDKNSDDSTYGFETPSRQACKHLWKCCVEHHAFFRLVQVSPTSVGTGVFSMNSRFIYSGETEKQADQQVQIIRRPPPQFDRRPSKRYSRRTISGDENKLKISDEKKNIWDTNNKYQNGSLKRPASAAPSSKYNRITSTNSLPRHMSLVMSSPAVALDGGRSDLPPESLQDLSLQSLQWLESRTSTHHARRSSLSEQVHSANYQRRSSRKLASVAGQSDNESEASGVSWASGNHGNRKRIESGSESERSVRRTHRSRRKRQGSYKLIESDDQWQAIQQRQHHRSRPNSSHGHRDSGTALDSTLRKSGYINSGAETEVDSASRAGNMRRNRRRSRSRSPGESRARLPSEVVKHLEFGLVEPSADSMRGEIPFTNVQTAATRPIMSRAHQQARRYGHNGQIPLDSQPDRRISPLVMGNPIHSATSTLTRRPHISTPSGSPRTTVSELLGMTPSQRQAYPGTPDMRHYGHDGSQQPLTQLQQLPQKPQHMSLPINKPSLPLNTNGVRTNPMSSINNGASPYSPNVVRPNHGMMNQQNFYSNQYLHHQQLDMSVHSMQNRNDGGVHSNNPGYGNASHDNDDNTPLPPPPPLPPGVPEYRSAYHSLHHQTLGQSQNSPMQMSSTSKYSLPPTVLTSNTSWSPFDQNQSINGLKHGSQNLFPIHRIVPHGDEMSTEL